MELSRKLTQMDTRSAIPNAGLTRQHSRKTESVQLPSEEETGSSPDRFALGSGPLAVMSLIQCAKLNGHYAYRYLKDVLERLPTQRASQVVELLPHRWTRPVDSPEIG